MSYGNRPRPFPDFGAAQEDHAVAPSTSGMLSSPALRRGARSSARSFDRDSIRSCALFEMRPRLRIWPTRLFAVAIAMPSSPLRFKIALAIDDSLLAAAPERL